MESAGENEKAVKRRKIVAGALLLMQQQSFIFSTVARLYESPSEILDIVRRDNFENFMKTVNLAIESNETKVLFGLEEEHFQTMLSICRKRDRSIRVSPAARIFIFMKYVREGRSENYLAKDVGVSQPTISRIVKETCEDLLEVAQDFIKFPSSLKEIRALEKGFMTKLDNFGNLRRIPCFGCIDGKHWATEHPPNSGSLNANYKSFFSYNSIAVCDSDTRILYLQISELGVNNDAQLVMDGPLPTLLEKTMRIGGFRLKEDGVTILPPFVIGDNGFRLSKSVMEPYRQSDLSAENFRFNKRLSAVRVRVENLFGIITSKFQIFDRSLKLSPENSRSIIAALCVLHNIQVGPLIVDDDEEYDDDATPILSDPYNSPEEMRTALKKYVLNN